MHVYQRYVADVKTIVRHVRHRPSLFALGAVLLGGGAGLAVLFASILYAGSVRALPYREPAFLFQAASFTNPSCAPACIDLVSARTLKAWRERATKVVGFGAARLTRSEIEVAGVTRSVVIAEVDSGFFSQLGGTPELGRFPGPADFGDGRKAAAVLAHSYWMSALAGRQDVVGSIIRIGDADAVIVGVAVPSFEFPLRASMWVTASSLGSGIDDTTKALYVVGRRTEGGSLEPLTENLAVIDATLARESDARRDSRAAVALPINWVAGTHARETMLGIAVILAVLLVTSANLTGLALARTIAREREFGVRLALGARPRDLVRLILLEGMALGVGATVIGALATIVGKPIARGMVEQAYGYPVNLAIHPLGALGVAVATMLLSLLVTTPSAVWLVFQSSATAARDGVASVSHRAGRVRHALIVMEVAVVLCLVCGAGVLAAVIVRLRGFDLGYDASHLVAARLEAPTSDASLPASFAVDEMLRRVSSLPEVRAVALYTEGYPRNARGPDAVLTIDGRLAEVPPVDLPPYEYQVTPGFFETIGVAMKAGRSFTPADRFGTEPVAIINVEAARRWFGESAPIGRRFTLRSEDHGPVQLTVVGIVGNTHVIGDAGVLGALRNPGYFPLVFRPITQGGAAQSPKPVPVRPSAIRLLVRSLFDPRRVVADIERIGAAAPGGVRTLGVTTVRDATSAFGPLAAAEIRARLTVILAIVGAIVTLVGVFGLVVDSAQRRRRELGIRAALGATGGRIVLHVAGGGFRSAVLGVAIGTVGAVMTGSALIRVVPEASSLNSFLFAAGAAVLLLIATAAAAAMAALDARRTSPMMALREE